jgi:hypothetical protein
VDRHIWVWQLLPASPKRLAGHKAGFETRLTVFTEEAEVLVRRLVPRALARSLVLCFVARSSRKLLVVLWRLLLCVPDMANEPVGKDIGLAEKQMNGGGQVEVVAGGNNGCDLSSRRACG